MARPQRGFGRRGIQSAQYKAKTTTRGNHRMENAFLDRSILDVMRILSSQGESGRLQVTSGMTNGAVFVDRGQLIDARFGRLTGFQAINALASIPDATFNFDPSIAPPTRSSISPNERILLQDFFGISAVHEIQQHQQYFPFEGTHNHAPAQVVPLSEVDERKKMEMREPFATENSSLSLSAFTESTTTTQTPTEAAVSDDDEVTVVRSTTPRAENRPVIAYGTISRSRFRPALFFTILTILIAAAAFAIIYRLREGSSQTPVAAVQTSTPAGSPQVSKSTETPPVVSDLSGNWSVVNTVEQTSYQPYKNMEVGFELAINQTGNEFTGKGQKISENGRSLSGTSRTPILVQGSIDGDRVKATFSESGATRKTSGRFVWRVDRAKGGLTGTFASSAARSSGRSAATKRL